MTHQEIFDTVLTKLRAQGVRSTGKNDHGITRCRYRGEEGLKCAVGHLIPDNFYNPDMEYMTVYEIMSHYNFWLPHDAGQLLEQLQQAHDDALQYGLPAWEYAMREVAREEGLTYTPPNPVYEPTDEEGSTND